MGADPAVVPTAAFTPPVNGPPLVERLWKAELTLVVVDGQNEVLPND